MLLLSHLQNQIKYYYPSKMNQHLYISKEKEESPVKQSQTMFNEAVERQRKLVDGQQQRRQMKLINSAQSQRSNSSQSTQRRDSRRDYFRPLVSST